MDPQEGDIAEDGGGNFLIYRDGNWYPSDERGTPKRRVPRADYGDRYFQQPNGDIVREGPRGGFEVIERAGATATGGAPPLVGADARARFMMGLGPLQDAQRIIDRMEAEGYGPNKDIPARALDQIPMAGAAARFIGGGDFNEYVQAAKTFEAAILPIMSGAAVTPSEADRQLRATIPQTGDTPTVLAQKSRQRRMMINAIAQGIGQTVPYPDVQGSTGDREADAFMVKLAGSDAIASAPAPGGPNGPQPGDVRVTSRPLAAEDTPASLAAQGYVYDAARDTWSRSRQEVVPEYTPQGAVEQRRDMNPIMRRVDGFVRGAADTMTFGLADEFAAGANTILPLERGTRSGFKNGFGAAYENNLRQARGVDADDARDIGFTRGAGQIAGAIAAPGAMAAGRFVAGAANVGQGALRGAMTGAGLGAAYGAGNAEGGLGARSTGAMTGGATGAVIGGALPPLARGLGMTANALGGRALADTLSDVGSRIMGRPMTGEARAARTLGRGTNLPDMEARAAQYRSDGIEPTFADIAGSNVQSRTRVAATRQTPGREVAERFSAGRRSEVQDQTLAMGRRISPTEGSPQQLNDTLESYQRAASGPEFAAARAGPPIRLDADTAQALWGSEGRRAVASAARAYESATTPEDRLVAQELAELSARMRSRPTDAGTGMGGADDGLEMSVGAADLLSRYLNKAGGQDQNLQRIFGGLGKAVRGGARQRSPEYDAALQGYEQRARLGDATEIGERFIGNKGYVADFEQGIGEMQSRGAGRDVVPQGTVAPERVGGELQVARAASRAAFERAAGTPRGANQVLDAFADGPDQRRRAVSLMGPDQGRAFSESASLRRSLMTTANNVNPRAGSSSFMNFSDDDGLESAAGNLMKARPISAAMDLIRSRFTSDEQAETIVRLALDRGRTDEVLNILRTRFPEQEARNIMERLTPAIAGQVGGATAPSAPRIRMVEPTR